MEATNNKKEILVLRIYAILILLYAVSDIITEILPKFLKISIIPNTTLINHFFILTGISLYITPINIIVGYGLLRRRFWARYAAIAVMMTFSVYIFSQYLYLEKIIFYRYSVYILLFFVVLTLYFFTRKRVKALFGEHRPFKLISWHGLLVGMIILFSFNSIFLSIFMKIKYNVPLSFYAAKPQVTILKKSNLPETPEKYLKHEILNTSLLIPKGFIIRCLFKDEGGDPGWRVTFQDKGKVVRGSFLLTNVFPYRDDDYKYFGKSFGHISKFDLEKYMRTNNWNPGVAISRYWVRTMGDLIDLKEIHMNGAKGFWERRQTDELFLGRFTLYNEDQYVEIGYFLIKKYFNEDYILPVLSSIEFLKPEDPNHSQNHYEKGLMLYKRGDVPQAQIEFANAYMLSPQNPDFIFMLAKSLFSKEIEDEDYVRDLLKNVLKLKPDHKKAQKLLKEIESKLPKKAKK